MLGCSLGDNFDLCPKKTEAPTRTCHPLSGRRRSGVIDSRSIVVTVLYKLTQEQEILRETIREFAHSEIEPYASRIDSECFVPSDVLRKLPNFGLFGITVPGELGGAGTDFLS